MEKCLSDFNYFSMAGDSPSLMGIFTFGVFWIYKPFVFCFAFSAKVSRGFPVETLNVFEDVHPCPVQAAALHMPSRST